MANPTDFMPLDRWTGHYWLESRRPLAALALVVPLLVVYESGVLWFGVEQNGADAFLQRLLEWLGVGRHFVLPLSIVVILLAWQHLSRAPWKLSVGVLPAMAVESLLLGFCLRAFSLFHVAVVQAGIGQRARDCVGYLGAGIYEELLFRLILFSALTWMLRRLGIAPRAAVVSAVILSSLLFAAAHYVGPHGDAMRDATFIFRTLAGVFFAVVFRYRGFGIAAGSHAAYDVMAC